MNENYIIVENVTEEELEIFLMDFSNLNINSELAKGIQLYRKKEDSQSFLVLFNSTPNFSSFNYMVNYLRYATDKEGYAPFIRGFYQTSDIQKSLDFKTGDWIMVYVSKNDKEYDNTNLVNSNNETYLYDFGRKAKRLNMIEETFQLIRYDKSNFYHILDIFPSNMMGEGKPKLSQKLSDFFSLLFSLIFVGIGIIVYDKTKDIALTTIIFFGLASLLFLWKILDPERFTKNTK